MIWLVVEDPQYLQNINILNHRIKELKLPLPELTRENSLFVPTERKININMVQDISKIVIDYRHPKDIVRIDYSIFTIIEIETPDFPFTTEHKTLNVDKGAVLSRKLGLRITKPSVTLDDMAGASVLHEDIGKMLSLEAMNIMRITGLFLFGVAGAGKSFFAECFAGTTGRHFVMLDLSYFMSLPNPVKSIDDVFVFLLSQDEKYLLLIDEIEKMFQLDGASSDLTSDQVFGKMLTWLSTIYEMENSNLTFVATANRVENLLKNKPEFVRRGRFDRLYFLNYPKIDSSAPEICTLYLNKEKRKLSKALRGEFEKHKSREPLSSKPLQFIYDAFVKSSLDVELLINKIIDNDGMSVDRIIQVVEGLIGKDKITDAQYFVYTPPEIKSLVREILQSYANEVVSLLYVAGLPFDFSTIDNLELKPIQFVLEDIVFKTPPLQITAPAGIGHQLAQAKAIKQGDRIAPFTEVS